MSNTFSTSLKYIEEILVILNPHCDPLLLWYINALCDSICLHTKQPHIVIFSYFVKFYQFIFSLACGHLHLSFFIYLPLAISFQFTTFNQP